MFEDLLERVTELKGRSKPFVLATVVACKPPTSAKPGAKAIVQADGSFHGWVGGSCAQPLVIQESLKALQDGQARLALLSPDPSPYPLPQEEGRVRGFLGLEGVVPIPMTCQSEGTLAIYLEPFLPRPQLLVIGQSPMARSLVSLGSGLGFRVSACDPAANKELFPEADSLVQDLDAIKENISPGSHVVIATMGHYDEEALAAVLGGPGYSCSDHLRPDYLRYVGLVASPRRGRAVIEYVEGIGVSPETLQRVKYPAGLDIGAETPEEIALSILTEIVQQRRASGLGIQLETTAEGAGPSYLGAEAVDPVCKMTVRISDKIGPGAGYSSTHQGETFYFCCLGCREEFDREPGRYSAQAAV